jgi:glycosyltransferase involved in cell wall biosynthesis
VRGLSDTALHAYYAHAAGFLFLSWIEGFGFPPLEALCHGTPVLCSDIPSLREVTFGRARYAPAGDPQAIGSQIVSLLEDAAAPSAAISPEELLSRFSWHACADGVWAVLQDVADRRGVGSPKGARSARAAP